MNNKFLLAKDLVDTGPYKFIQFDDKSFMFCQVELLISHLEMATRTRGERKIIAAGIIFLADYMGGKNWWMESLYSESLNIGCSGENEDELAEILVKNGWTQIPNPKF